MHPPALHCPTTCTKRPKALFTSLMAQTCLQNVKEQQRHNPTVFTPSLLDEQGALLPDHLQQHCSDCFVGYAVHNTHCCTQHGCKYCDDQCPVVLGAAAGIFCEDCQQEQDEYPYQLQRITGLTVEQFEQLKADAQSWRLHCASIRVERTTL